MTGVSRTFSRERGRLAERTPGPQLRTSTRTGYRSGPSGRPSAEETGLAADAPSGRFAERPGGGQPSGWGEAAQGPDWGGPGQRPGRPGGDQRDWPGGDQRPDWPGGDQRDWPGSGQRPDWPGGDQQDWPGGQRPDWPGGDQPDWPGGDQPDWPAGGQRLGWDDASQRPARPAAQPAGRRPRSQ